MVLRFCESKGVKRISFLAWILLLGSCSPILSDPVFNGDAPDSPGSAWRDNPFVGMEGEQIPQSYPLNPYTEADLLEDDAGQPAHRYRPLQ